MLKLLLVALVTVAATDLSSAVVLVSMSDYGEMMEDNPLGKVSSFPELERNSYGYSKAWRLYLKVVMRSFVLAMKREADSYAQKHRCSLPEQKGLLRLNKEFFRYHIRTVLYTIRYFKNRLARPPRTREETQNYIDDMTRKCAKVLNLGRAYSYALSHNMPVCRGNCWDEAKELPEHIHIPKPSVTGNDEESLFARQ